MLSATSEYALRALVRLALVPADTAVLGRDLAAKADIPVNYLSKILLTLRNAGFLATARGTGGGYRLKKRPEEIRLLEVVELFEGSRAKPSCFLGGGKECSDADPCSAHQAWREVRRAYSHFLETTTIAAIAAPLPSKEEPAS